MKTNWLFPHRYRLIGWLILIPSLLLGLACMYGEFQAEFLTLTDPTLTGLDAIFNRVNLTDELAAVGIIVGLAFIAFAREKVEDEMINQLRLESLQWAVYVNYLILGVAILLVHGGAFLSVLVYNLFTVLVVFIVRFRLALHRTDMQALTL